MGRKFLMVSGFNPGFLKKGVTAASLRMWGTEPELRKELMTVMSEEMAGRQSFTSLDGVERTGGDFHVCPQLQGLIVPKWFGFCE